jgi:hypothetical protein
MSDDHLSAHFDALKEFIQERYRKTDAKLDRVLDDIADLTARVGGLEQGVALLHKDLALSRETGASTSVRLDRLVRRVERIEKRLDLIDDQPVK